MTDPIALDDAIARPLASDQTAIRLAYFVHDLNDPAVERRLTMLRDYIEDAAVIGFYRGATAPEWIAGWPAISLGYTEDAKLAKRILSVASGFRALTPIASILSTRTAFLSRQLEVLPLALAARNRYAPAASVVHEILDVHRLLARPSIPGYPLRLAERHFLEDCDAIITSSPAFARDYLTPVHGGRVPPVLLVENKILGSEDDGMTPASPLPAGPPWRIGWFGVIRCATSLHLLANALCERPGLLEIDIRGRSAASAIPEFSEVVAATPGMTFGGPYDRRTDLPGLYGGVHMTWAIDYFEAGGNSDWLLPNRLYEGSTYGAVPIALETVETGRWLASRRAGIVLREPLRLGLIERLEGLTPDAWTAEWNAVAALPRDALVDDGRDGFRIANVLLRRFDVKQKQICK